MVRSAVAVLALAILPSFALAQEATHTVERGNTLRGIALRYYGDESEWPRIWEANRDRVSDPDFIVPGMELTIPGAGARVTGVQVSAEPVQPGEPVAEMPAEEVPVEMVPRVMRRDTGRETVFSRERGAPEGVGFGRDLLDVPPEQFYSAPWLIPEGTVPARIGSLESLAGGEDARATRASARVFDRINVSLEGAAPPVGSRLQTFRMERDIRDLGHVVVPTGILVVEETAPGGVVARVDAQFARIVLGDLVRVLPPFTPRPASALQPVEGGGEAVILAFARDHELQTFGDHAFLDVGASDGVRIGDEYMVIWSGAPDWNSEVEGWVKVVAVQDDVATARVTHLENPVFIPGVRLRQSRRIP